MIDGFDNELECESPKVMPIEDPTYVGIQIGQKSSKGTAMNDLKHQNDFSGVNCHFEDKSDKTLDTDDELDELGISIDEENFQSNIANSHFPVLFQRVDKINQEKLEEKE